MNITKDRLKNNKHCSWMKLIDHFRHLIDKNKFIQWNLKVVSDHKLNPLIDKDKLIQLNLKVDWILLF